MPLVHGRPILSQRRLLIGGILNNLSRAVPEKTTASAAVEQIDTMIRAIRGTRVMLDRDFAQIYGVPTEVFNQAVKRNAPRFPEDFMFRLTKEEVEAVRVSRSQIVTLKRGQNAKYLPYAFLILNFESHH